MLTLMRSISKLIFLLFLLIVTILFYSNTSVCSLPKAWQIGFPIPATEIMESVIKSHSFIMKILGSIMIFIFILLAYTIFRFHKSRAERNKYNVNITHNTFLEITWFLIPMIIAVILAIKNAELIKLQEKIPKSDLTLKVIGHQWYWNYKYPEYQDISFDSYIKIDDDFTKEDLKLLSVDNRVVLPVNSNIRLQVTGGDVIHSWGVPAFGIKVDAIPGRLNEAWFNIKKPGIYYGQCYELCGQGHGFMPIVVEAMSKEDFNKWIKNKNLITSS